MAGCNMDPAGCCYMLLFVPCRPADPWSVLNVLQKAQFRAAKAAASQNISVFLGGACNPTTWRQDIAMPMLDAAGISYYNPQVGGKQ